MATIERRTDADGRARYRVKIRKRGHRPLSRTFDRLAAARRWARDSEAAIDHRAAFPGSESERRTLAEAVDRYLAEVLPHLAPTNHPRQKARALWWRDQLGHLELAAITPATIAEARSALEAGDGLSGEPVSGATVNRYHAALSAILRAAQRRWHWLPVNPAREVERAREAPAPERYLSAEEVERLTAACWESRDRRLAPMVTVALATGARASELMRMRWRDVDLTARRWVIPQAKSGQPRTVPLAPQAVDALREVVRVVGVEYVWTPAGVSGASDGPPRFPRGPWERSRERAGLGDVRWHDLRHTAASWLAMSGASTADIMAILGHRSLAAAQRYLHLTADHLGDVADRMAGRLWGE